MNSGDYVTIEALTHHANDDTERMVKGDPGAESVYLWTKDKKGVNRRGAGPVDGKLLGAARARASASISAPVRSISATPNLGTSSKCASWT